MGKKSKTEYRLKTAKSAVVGQEQTPWHQRHVLTVTCWFIIWSLKGGTMTQHEEALLYLDMKCVILWCIAGHCCKHRNDIFNIHCRSRERYQSSHEVSEPSCVLLYNYSNANETILKVRSYFCIEYWLC